MDISVNICLGTFMLYITEEINRGKLTLQSWIPVQMYSYATYSVSNFWRCTWGLLFYLLKIMSPQSSSVEEEWIWIKFAQLINSCLCRKSLGLNLGHPPSSSLPHLPMQWLIYQVVIEHLLSDRFLKQQELMN